MINQKERFFYDRSFWIYFIIASFFALLGLPALVSGNPWTTIIWLINIYLLMAIVYWISVKLSPRDDNDCAICLIDTEVDMDCLKNRAWIWVNIFYLLLLVLSTMWAWGINEESSYTMIGVIIILVTLLMISIVFRCKYEPLCYSFYISFFYLIIWVSLILYQIHIN